MIKYLFYPINYQTIKNAKNGLEPLASGHEPDGFPITPSRKKLK